MKHLFIINGQALDELKRQLDQSIRQIFQNKDYSIEYTHYSRHATQIAKAYTEKYKELRIYACGGDGTLHEIANGIYPHTHVQLAIVPIGTGNDFVRGFGYERSDFKNLKNYLDPVYLWSDLIRVSDQKQTEVAINTFNLGFDARIAAEMPRFRKTAGAANAYYLAMIYCLRQPINELFKLEVDGKRIPDRKYMFVVACNGSYYGGGFKPCPQASVSDGWLDLCFIHDVPIYRIPDLSLAYKKGEHLKYTKFAKNQKIKQLKVMNDSPVLVCLDGEIRTMTKPLIEVIPHQIQLCLPKKQLKH